MNYIGSKLSLLEFIENGINKVVGKSNYTFSDLFAGTGIVGRYFKLKGHKVIANDLQYYSYILNRHYIGNHKELKFEKLSKELTELKNIEVSERKIFVCQYLNNIDGLEGFIFKNYCKGGTNEKEHERLYFSDENGKKCDSIRSQIELWKNNKLIVDNEYYFLLTCLLEAIDKVANTASVYGAFLKKLKKSAINPLLLKPVPLFENDNEHDIYNEDINKLVLTTSHDVVYLDPPYNHRQYSGNYHLLETIAKYDSPKIKGITGMRDCSEQKSKYCSRGEVKKSFEDLVSKIDAKYIFLSYNDEGLMTLGDIKEILSKRGEYGFFEKNYNRFKADKSENRNFKQDSVIEYLHYVKIKQ